MSRIAGKLALVTGASAGIRLEAEADALRRTHGVTVRTATVDVRDRAAVERTAAELVAAGAVPDILVNNAGLAAGLDKLHEGDPDDWDRMIDTNIKGLLYVSRAFLPHMVARVTRPIPRATSTGRRNTPCGP
jgi:NADP-dependent 3-hydroxy acid dehydrogenase YdfG